MRIVYVPDYLMPALTAAGVGVKELVSVTSLASILSPEDVAFYLYVNIGKLELAVPQDIANSMRSLVVDQEPYALFGPLGNTEDLRMREIKRVMDEYYANESAPTLDLQDKVLKYDLIDEDTIRFTHVLEDSTIGGLSATVKKRRLYDGVIQLLYGFMPFETIAQMPLMAGFLKSSKQLQEGVG